MLKAWKTLSNAVGRAYALWTRIPIFGTSFGFFAQKAHMSCPVGHPAIAKPYAQWEE